MQTDIYMYNVLARCYVVTKVYKVHTVYVIQSLLVGLMSICLLLYSSRGPGRTFIQFLGG